MLAKGRTKEHLIANYITTGANKNNAQQQRVCVCKLIVKKDNRINRWALWPSLTFGSAVDVQQKPSSKYLSFFLLRTNYACAMAFGECCARVDWT